MIWGAFLNQEYTAANDERTEVDTEPGWNGTACNRRQNTPSARINRRCILLRLKHLLYDGVEEAMEMRPFSLCGAVISRAFG